MFQTPVLFIIFNRPEATEKVFNAIRDQKPKYLFIAADGPRQNNQADIDLCKRSREIVAAIDWDCKVKTLFREKNLGCGAAPAQAITWFFENVEQGIILEDDCLPNHSFFTFCEDLLEKYKDEPKIKMISGTSYQSKPLNTNSYYFSRYVHVWGWATWRRAWEQYEFKLSGYNPAECLNMLNRVFTTQREREHWLYNFSLVINGLDCWDYQLMYHIWKNDGITIIPWKNIVSNIGFGLDATHTFSGSSSQSNMPRFELERIIHPNKITINTKADKIERYSINIYSPFRYIKVKILSKFRGAVKRLSRKKGS